jgi:hypothetical protein
VCSGGVDLAPTQPFGEPYERGTWERVEAHGKERIGDLLKGTPLNLLSILLLPLGPLYTS